MRPERQRQPGHVPKVSIETADVPIRGDEDEFNVVLPDFLVALVKFSQHRRELSTGAAPVCAKIEEHDLLVRQGLGGVHVTAPRCPNVTIN